MTTSAIDTDYLSTLSIAKRQTTERSSGLGQEEFLELMITQFRNQDPFKPLDADEMLGQLAQFGTVAGLSEVKGQIEALSANLLSDQSLQATTLVGRNVLVASGHIALEEGVGAQGAVQVPVGTQQVAVGVLDAAGTLVDTVDLGAVPAGTAHFTWDGIGADGKAVPPGVYAVQAYGLVDGATIALETFAGAPVSSVSLGGTGGAITLNLGALGAFAFADVREIYD